MPSSYFSPPSDHLDPVLFDGDQLKEEIRQPLLTAPVTTLQQAGLKNPHDWLRIWLTGSAISYQWQADRGNGDLDVQLGIEYERFLTDNPEYHSVDKHLMSDRINRYLRENLWPKMSHANFGGKEFEVTFYWDYLVDNTINSIHPYAAYDVINNTWVITPPTLPSDPRALYPQSWYESTQPDLLASQRLLQRHTELSKILAAEPVGSAKFITNSSAYKLIVSQAHSLYNDIHGGRQEAFTKGGQGYGDYHNFRWQVAKDTNTIGRLKTIIDSSELPTNTPEQRIKSAREALEEAMTFRLGKRFG